MKKIIIAAALASALWAGSANAYVLGHSCSLWDTKPVKPYSFNSQWEIDAYNTKVRNWNSAMEDYRLCINTYIADAKRAIKRAVADYNNAQWQ